MVGLLLGWWFHDIGNGKWFTPDGVLSALVTIGVGWWIQHALYHRSELERIPVAGVEKICDRIEAGIIEALVPREKPDDPTLVSTLHQLSNDIFWLRSTAVQVGIPSARGEGVASAFFELKEAVSDAPARPAQAMQASWSLRLTSLRLQMEIAAKVMKDLTALS